MSDDEDTTIGTGGWALTALSGLISFAGLYGLLHYRLFPSVVFALAIALIVLLLLHRLATAVNRYDDAEEAQRVRKIVPASGSGGPRAGAGAASATTMAVPLRSETSTPVPVRPSSVVRPLAEVAPAPIIAPPPMPVAAVDLVEPAAAKAVEVKAVEVKAEPKGEVKPKAKPAPKAKADATTADDAAKVSSKAKAAVKTAAKPDPAAKADAASKPNATKAGAAKVGAAKVGAAKVGAAKVGAAKAGAGKTGAAIPEGLVRLKAPRKGLADDLKEIEGIGPALEKTVNALGFYHFDQIAAWTAADVALVDAEMKTFKGRIARDKWVEQARIIVSEGLDVFRERAKTNDY